MGKKVVCLLLLALLAFGSSSVWAEPRTRVAVVEFDVKGDLEVRDAGAIIAEWLITALASDTHFELKAREVLLKKVLQEQALNATGIIDKETVVGIGKIYGVEAIITGSVSKWGKIIKVDARLINAQTGSVVRAADIEAVDIEDIPKQIKWLAAKIANDKPTNAPPGADPAIPRHIVKEWEGKTYHLLDLSAQSNARLQKLGSIAVASQFPEGETPFGGIPFYIPAGRNNIWLSSAVDGPNPHMLEVALQNVKSPIAVYTLVNCEWGKRFGQSDTYIEFIGSNGAYYKKALKGDEDIRDWLKGKGWRPVYPQDINNRTTVNAITIKDENNEARLDRQKFELPEAFRSQELRKIRLVDSGDTYVHRAFLAAVTVVCQ